MDNFGDLLEKQYNEAEQIAEGKIDASKTDIKAQAVDQPLANLLSKALKFFSDNGFITQKRQITSQKIHEFIALPENESLKKKLNVFKQIK